MRINLSAIALIGGALLITGCNNEPPEPDQSSFCEVSELGYDAISEDCTENQKIGFFPDTFGNEQMPAIFAALYCDHRFEIAMTNGGVSCIYKPVDREGLDLQ